MSSNLAQIPLILKKKPDVSDQASRNSPRTQYTLNDFSEYRMDFNLAQEKEPGKYMNGDVVVYMNHIKIKDLQTVEAYQPNNHYWLESGKLVKEADIRAATLPELFHKRRLDEIEQSIAEVP